ncbi:MAG: recombinase [Bacteroidetes bacterium]|nr:recombinase [Bacteroidota bacterium]
MTYTVDFLDDFHDDLINSFRYYEKQAPGLGDELLMSVDATVNYISRHPLHYQKIFLETRKANLKRFPFAVFYLVHKDKILITAVMHLFRDSKEWKLRQI